MYLLPFFRASYVLAGHGSIRQKQEGLRVQDQPDLDVKFSGQLGLHKKKKEEEEVEEVTKGWRQACLQSGLGMKTLECMHRALFTELVSMEEQKDSQCGEHLEV